MAHEHIVYMMLTDSAALTRDLEALKEYTPQLMELARRDDHRPYIAIADRAMGIASWLSGEHTEAQSYLQGALGQFQELDMTWQAGRTLHDMGQVARDLGDQERACSYFTQALDAFDMMGAKPAAEAASTSLQTCS